MTEIVIGVSEDQVLQDAINYAKEWCDQHQWEVGAAEMALGAAAIAWGVQNGYIEIGRHFVASQWNMGELIGGGIGTGIGAIGGAVLGAIGVAGGGGAIAIPAALVIGGGALIFGSVGYATGDLISKFLNPPIDLTKLFSNASILAVGVALLIDGARRVVKDERVLATASRIKDGVIYMAQLTVQIIANTMAELRALMDEMVSKPDSIEDAAGTAATATIVAAGGATIGGSIAAGTVTILGSHTLGAAALSLGLVSAPVWPVIAAGAAGLGIGYAAWKSVKFLGGRLK